MQTTPLSRPGCLRVLGACALALFPSTFAQIHSLGYDTPSYVDFELSEVTVREDQPTAVVNIYRTGDFRQVSRFSYATEEESASEGKDYKGVGGTLIFQAGEAMKQIEIPVLADNATEDAETFRIVLSAPNSTTTLLRTSIVVTIQDVPPAAQPPKLDIAAAGGGKISLSWDGAPNYTLERAADPASALWEKVPCTPTVTGTRCEVVEPAGGVVYVYRLRGN